jgi:hypothetical protein
MNETDTRDYKILSSDRLKDLEAQVSQALSEGFVLAPGFAVRTTMYYQPVYKPREARAEPAEIVGPPAVEKVEAQPSPRRRKPQ